MAEKKKTIFEAIAKLQYEAPILVKNTTGYGYKYADITEVIKKINPLLKKHNLFVMQPLEGTGIKTIICHWPTGDKIESYSEIPQDIHLKGMNAFQSMGAGITYCRRYALCSFLGLIADKDIDVAEEVVNVKPKLTEKRFNEALKAIEKGDYTQAELRNKWNLTNNQLKQLP